MPKKLFSQKENVYHIYKVNKKGDVLVDETYVEDDVTKQTRLVGKAEYPDGIDKNALPTKGVVVRERILIKRTVVEVEEVPIEEPIEEPVKKSKKKKVAKKKGFFNKVEPIEPIEDIPIEDEPESPIEEPIEEPVEE